MQNSNRLAVLALFTVCLMILACSQTLADTIEIEPATLERIEGTELSQVVLTAKAAERLDIQTAEVQADPSNADAASPRTIVPYSSIMYDEHGNNFTYIAVEPLVFRRADIVVEYIEGQLVYLLDGPAVGTAVVTVGAAELYGVETGVGK